MITRLLQTDTAEERYRADPDELFEMTNLYPSATGLPMVVWVGPSYGMGHDVRIKVMRAHGQQMDPGNLAVVALRPTPHLVAGQLSPGDLQLVSEWLALNEAAVLDHWNAVIDGVGLAQRLRRLGDPPREGRRRRTPRARS